MSHIWTHHYTPWSLVAVSHNNCDHTETHTSVTWIIHLGGITYSRVTCTTPWLIQMWHDTCKGDMTHSSVTCLIQVWHDSFIWVTWLIYVWHARYCALFRCDIGHSSVTWLLQVTWLIQVWHDWFIWVTWFIHSVARTVSPNCPTSEVYLWVMSLITVCLYVWVISMILNESCQLLEWVVTLSHVTHEWVMSRVNESCRAWMNRVTLKWVMTHMNGSCHKWISHVTHEWVIVTQYRVPTATTISNRLVFCQKWITVF